MNKHVRLASALGLIIVSATLAILVASTPIESRQLPPKFSSVVELESSYLGSVVIRKLQICSCWEGPNGQVQKKVKMELLNKSAASLSLMGDTGSNIYLLVKYPEDINPIVNYPVPQSGSGTTTAGTPPGVPLRLSTDTTEVVPALIPGTAMREKLGVQDGWRVWAIPSNPNLTVEAMHGDDVTFPTSIGEQWLSPGHSYYEERYGWGSWVFYVPIGDAADFYGRGMISTLGTTEYTDRYYVVLGIAVIVGEHLLAFAPTPPQSVWSNGADF